MTVLEAIGLADEMKPNSVPQVMKVRWLCVLDGLIWRNVFRTHGMRGEFQPYDPDTDLGRELLVKAPYDTLYRRWLEAQIDLSNGEYERYNAQITVFSDEYAAFENDFHRNHRPVRRGRRFVF